MASGRAGGNCLTRAQTRLLKRHRTGLLRLASEFAAKRGMAAPTEIMLVIAHRQSCLGDAIRRFTDGGTASKDAVVLPALAKDLPKWLERLAVAGPVWDCTASDDGVPIIVVDEYSDIALCRLPALSVAGRESSPRTAR